MLCQICWLMLRGQEGRQWKGSYDLYFVHHRNVDSLIQSAGSDCNICMILCKELAVAAGLDAWDGSDSTAGWVKRLNARPLQGLSGRDDTRHAISSASLSIMNGSNLYGNEESKKASRESISSLKSQMLGRLGVHCAGISPCACLVTRTLPCYPLNLS
jgi:hypothetical protein